MKIGRNAPCHCGSGKKYKFCHARKEAQGKGDWSKIGMVVAAAVLVLVVAVFVTSVIDADGAGADGRVWSAEHGHWHNVDGSELGASRAAPPGLPPPGKVWSEEHGHWHDIE